MMFNKVLSLFSIVFICIISAPFRSISQQVQIHNHTDEKQIQFGNGEIQLKLDYNGKATITSLLVNGREVLAADRGIYSLLNAKTETFSSLQLLSQPVVNTSQNTITLSSIQYGSAAHPITETWKFNIRADSIQFTITRKLPVSLVAEKTGLPVFIFKDTSTWDGAYTDYGGLAWFYLFNKKRDTYGVHTRASQFWNRKTGDGLNVAVYAPGNNIATDYSRTDDDHIACTIAVAPNEFQYRFDSGTNRRRYVRDTADVWAPVGLPAGTSTSTITLSYVDYKQTSDRGTFVGINGDEVTAVLNTIARIGVIDKQHFGGNSWHTPYGPICLHEQYIAQLGLGINDSNYLKGYRECLNFYRDNAITKEGRVWPRWAYSNEDAMPGKFTDKGFYEAQWGYLLDANPDYVSNVADLYNMNGDAVWVKTQQPACEKALDWILKRDSNGNNLVEMMTDSTGQHRGSDWIDIIWASYENAFVNAKLYHALILWADIEKQLGNNTKAVRYSSFAAKLKESFNKSTTNGGFWDETKKCYVHWRDKDGFLHGNNMVTPVNFMAIAYGICDDSTRTKTILDDIETEMQKEQLFFWPLCMYSYAKGEGNDWQFPFPNYENGDIFLSWGSVAVKAYAAYKPELALKYVQNVLNQYSKDGLAFQRYGRAKQEGLGDDILSGNSLSVVGLYQSIYGINPLYNRFYLEPHITDTLNGTHLKYNYRNRQLLIDLHQNNYAVSDDQFAIRCNTNFGFYHTGNALLYFNKHDDIASLQMSVGTEQKVAIEIQSWTANKMQWKQSVASGAATTIHYSVNQLERGKLYSIFINERLLKMVQSNGSISFSDDAKGDSVTIAIRKD